MRISTTDPTRSKPVAGPGRLRWACIALFLIAGWLGAPLAAAAQYFGQNKVKHEDFDFSVLETEHFQIYYYERERSATTAAARLAERWYARLSELLDHELRGKQPLILYANHPDFRQTTAIAGAIGEATGGVTEGLKRRIVLPMAGALAETDHVLGHELVHAFQYDLSGISPNRPTVGPPAISGLPLWMVEGMAEYYSLGARSALTAMWVRDAVATGRLPSVDDLADAATYFPYRWGHALWAFVGGTWGAAAPWEVLKEAARRRSVDAGLRTTLGVGADSLTTLWHGALRAAYDALQERTDAPDAVARPLITHDAGGSGLNLAPALSPDGSRLLFLSSRDPYAIDLYLADAETGAVIRRLTHSALDPHYESLQFVASSGAWAPDGERVAFATVRAGRPGIVVMRAATGERIREIALRDLGAVFNPSWSPDGRRLAFVANQGGYLDLWTVDAAGGRPRRLTSGPAAELHPAWSPDGRDIAVTTDRAGSGYGLALIRVETGEARPIPTPSGANSYQPRFGPDGTVYFVSDAGGWRNLYRVARSGGRPEPITRLFAGASGLTETSPVFDVASVSGRIVFTAFSHGRHELYRLDPPLGSRGPLPAGDVAQLPPGDRADGSLLALLGHASPAPPDTSGFVRRDYDAQLRLDYVAPPSLGFAVGGFGSFIGGGTAAYFSDMLGQHELSTQLQLQVRDGRVLDGIGAQATYVNRANRLHWGVTAGQVPQIAQGFGQQVVDVDGDGDDELVQRTLQYWTVSREAVGLLQYPFSRATRLELSAGAAQIGFSATSRREVFDLATGQRLSDVTVDAPACGDSLSVRRDLCQPGSLTLFRGVAALVHDNTIAGPTGPIAGRRARFEIAPSIGTLTYAAALADWRAYRRLAGPLTLATRVMHYGRYAADAEDQRLSQLFLGYPSLIRGYDNASFDLRACPTDRPIEDCSEVDVYERLFGSRLAVANAELRLSLLGPVGVVGRAFPVPMDLVGFADAGVAWRQDDPGTVADDRASFLGGDRDVLTSAGIGVRFNLLGFALGELYYVRPFDRPRRGGYLTLSLNTGF